MNTFSDRNRQTISESVAPETAFTSPAFVVGKPVAPARMRTCGQCQYDGPMQVRHTYPLLLRWPTIAVGFACGIVPGLFLLSWRRSTPTTIAMTCPMCCFMRLEQAPAIYP